MILSHNDNLFLQYGGRIKEEKRTLRKWKEDEGCVIDLKVLYKTIYN